MLYFWWSASRKSVELQRSHFYFTESFDKGINVRFDVAVRSYFQYIGKTVLANNLMGVKEAISGYHEMYIRHCYLFFTVGAKFPALFSQNIPQPPLNSAEWFPVRRDHHARLITVTLAR